MKEIRLPQTPRQLRLALARRLGIGAALVSLASGAAVYGLASQRTEKQTLENAIGSVQHFKSPAMQLALDGAEARHGSLEQMLDKERFVGIRVFDRKQELLFERWGDIPKPLIAAAKMQSHPWPALEHSHSKRINVAKEQLIQVVLPMAFDDGRLAGYIEGIGRVTAEALTVQQEQIEAAAITAAVSVLAAAILLYPLMLAMLHRYGSLSRRLLDANLSLMHSLGNAIAKRDSDTDAHNYRVTCYAVALAESLGLSDKAISELVVGAFLHDVGKIGIPDHILLKPGKLTTEEFEVMKTHTLLGVEIVADNPWLAGAAQTIRHHHERHDGSGYPDALSGQEIPLNARIFALVDVFDALTSVRPYKPALSLSETLAIMQREAGSHFDPKIYEVFRSLAPEFYEKNQTWRHEDWAAELRIALTRYFKRGNAPLTGRCEHCNVGPG